MRTLFLTSLLRLSDIGGADATLFWKLDSNPAVMQAIGTNWHQLLLS